LKGKQNEFENEIELLCSAQRKRNNESKTSSHKIVTNILMQYEKQNMKTETSRKWRTHVV